MLLHLKHIFIVYWMAILYAIYAVNAIHDGTRYVGIDRRLLPYEEQEFTSFATAPLRRGPKREIKLRTANGFGQRDDVRNSINVGKRVDSKIKKIQMGSLRTAIGFGKRSLKYGTQESDPALLQKVSQKENYPSDWYYEDATENDSDALLRIIRKFHEMKHTINDEESAQTDQPERPYSYERFSSNSLNLDDDQ